MPRFPGEGAEGVEGADDRRAVRPPAHSPADLDVAGAVAERRGEELEVVAARRRPPRPRRRESSRGRGTGRRRSPRRRRRPRGRRGPFRRGAPRRRGRARDRRPGEGRCTRRPGTRSCDGRGRSRTRRAPRAFASLRSGKEVDVRDERVLPPEEDPLRVREVEEVVRLLVAEVGLLRGVAGSGADVAALDGDRAEELEEVGRRRSSRGRGSPPSGSGGSRRARTRRGSPGGARRRTRGRRPRRPGGIRSRREGAAS